ncbi:hypothetical protein GDO81_019145 [Engystomops pustulosus]|uniref:C2H2-type domain-containing protein n=3 Tax=Engystomops pustulosus TaxID=76066 RepID=A0AAV6YZQ7_ENGPU|nr:hypothetical protein GDO81_019145 [Engystomops pustulosus]
MVVKKTSGERVAPVSSPHISGGPAIMLSPINKQKILELTFRVLYQLTGEDPEDATVSFCMEKEENSGGWDKGLVVAPHKEASPDPFVKNLPRYKVGPIKEEPPTHEDDDPVLSEDAEGGAICIKEEPDITHLQFYTTGNSPQQYPFVIKSELDGDDGERSEASSAGYVQNASVQIKEEPMSYEEGNTTAEPDHPSTNEYTSFQIKDESMSDEEGNFADADEHRITERRQYGPYGSEEETDSCGEGTSSETDVFSPVDPYPSAHSDPAPALYGDSHLQQDFLIFGEGSSFDTDVSALIKHAQTKYSFAPIEEVSDEGEAVASPKPHLSKDRPQPKSSGTDEAAGEEGSASQVKKDYKCSECSEIFVRRSDFANHRRDHRRERLTCPECGKLFSNKPSLLNHLTGHTGEKPYSCSICGKCFTRNSNLIVHQAIHMERSPLGTRNVGDFHYVKQILSLE